MRFTSLTLAVLTVFSLPVASFADTTGTAPPPPLKGFDFEAMDANKDGQLTLAEVQAYQAARLKAADTNGDGMLSSDELVAMTLAEMTKRATDHAAWMIARMDKNGDGVLSIDEILNAPGAGKMFKRIDSNGDGVISQAEIDAAKAKWKGHKGAAMPDSTMAPADGTAPAAGAGTNG